MKPHYRTILCMACALLLLGGSLFFPAAAFPQNEDSAPKVIQVGIVVAPPLCIKTADGGYEGFSVELWETVARHLKLPYAFREFSTLESLFDALEKGEIDVIPSMPVQERFAATMDYSQSYLKSGLSIAVPADGAEYRWIRVFESIFSVHILKAIGLLLTLSLMAGVIVWLCERRANSEMFGDRAVRGIGHGIWWAVVTMATVGYGDKAPKTLGGRFVAIAWMIFSIIFIASFTADITTSLTVSELRGRVRGLNDLYHTRVGSIPRTEAFDFLTKQGIAAIPFAGIREGVAAVADKKIDAFVLNEQVLKYITKSEFPGRVQVLPRTYDEYFLSMALVDKSQLRKPINNALLKLMKTRDWAEMLNRYAQ